MKTIPEIREYLKFKKKFNSGCFLTAEEVCILLRFIEDYF
jgi:predicted GH43/DUF377 family glycosyl hydrolase